MIALERTHNGPFHVCVDGAPPLSEVRVRVTVRVRVGVV